MRRGIALILMSCLLLLPACSQRSICTTSAYEYAIALLGEENVFLREDYSVWLNSKKLHRFEDIVSAEIWQPALVMSDDYVLFNKDIHWDISGIVQDNKLNCTIFYKSTPNDYYLAADIELQVLLDGLWYSVPQHSVAEELIILQEGTSLSVTLAAGNELQYPLPSGYYRLYLTNGVRYGGAEFSLEFNDGSYSISIS